MALLFPNVPSFSGVPPINRLVSAPSSFGETSLFDGLTFDASWGVFSASGGAALRPDSIFAIEPSREFRALDYPVEKGGFVSYNKVATPAETRVTMIKGGSDAERSAFLDALDSVIEDTELYSVVTADKAFLDRNLVRYEYRRTAESGATLLVVDLVMLEVRQTVKATKGNTAKSSGESPVSGGPVRAVTPGAADLPSASLRPSNATVGALPGILSTDAALAKAAKVSDLVRAGASIGDMIAKGVKFQSVPLLSAAAQSLAVTLGGQPVKLDILEKAFGTYINVKLSDNPIVSGVRALAEEPLVRASAQRFLGELMFYDKTGVKGAPTAGELGSRFSLLYAGA